MLSAIGVGGLVLGIHEGPEVGWAAPITVAGLVGGAVGLSAFVLWSLRRDHPLLDLRIFSNPRLAAGSMSLTHLHGADGYLSPGIFERRRNTRLSRPAIRSERTRVRMAS